MDLAKLAIDLAIAQGESPKVAVRIAQSAHLAEGGTTAEAGRDLIFSLAKLIGEWETRWGERDIDGRLLAATTLITTAAGIVRGTPSPDGRPFHVKFWKTLAALAWRTASPTTTGTKE